MDIDALQGEIDEISIILYQNQEQKAFELVGQLFGKLKTVTDALLQSENGNEKEISCYISTMYHGLHTAYQQKDVLGMADCLQEYAMLTTELYKEMLGR